MSFNEVTIEKETMQIIRDRVVDKGNIISDRKYTWKLDNITETEVKFTQEEREKAIEYRENAKEEIEEYKAGGDRYKELYEALGEEDMKRYLEASERRLNAIDQLIDKL